MCGGGGEWFATHRCDDYHEAGTDSGPSVTVDDVTVPCTPPHLVCCGFGGSIGRQGLGKRAKDSRWQWECLGGARGGAGCIRHELTDCFPCLFLRAHGMPK